MTNAAKKAGVTKTVIRANVDRNGAVTLRGDIPKGAINPIVEVNYEDNRNPIDVGNYAKAIVSKLQEKYGFTKMNMVGHSLGNMSILYYLLEHAQDEKLPQLQKQVNIANFAAGLEAMGLPADVKVDKTTGKPNQVTQTFQRLLPLREVFPQNQIVLPYAPLLPFFLLFLYELVDPAHITEFIVVNDKRNGCDSPA